MTTEQVPTPDFYTYRWDPLVEVAVAADGDGDGRFVELRWADGATLNAFHLWLRENAVGAGGVDEATREGLLDPAELSDDIAIGAARIGSHGELHITWEPDGTEAVYHPGWLRHVADGQHLATSWIPSPAPWTATTMPELPTHDGSKVLDDDEVFAAWLNDMLQHGVSRLRGCPLDADADTDFNVVLASRIGAVRDTNFGAHWDVKADVAMAGDASTNSTANTSRRLGPHTDLPTRETPPGFQFLRCIANEACGGFSTMADGAAVAEALQAEHPDHYESLTTLRWVFFNRGPGIDHRWSGPIVDLGVDGSPLTLRAFYPVRGFPDMAPDDMPRAYAAMRCFSRLADSDRFKLASPFLPGDLVGFDNRRILHGRNAFESGGHRHLRGMYIDHDEVRSAARVVNRRLGITHQPSPTS